MVSSEQGDLVCPSKWGTRARERMESRYSVVTALFEWGRCNGRYILNCKRCGGHRAGISNTDL